jgi:hypothetical protein
MHMGQLSLNIDTQQLAPFTANETASELFEKHNELLAQNGDL